MSTAPILFNWDGESMTPCARHWALEADKAFVVGERYRLVEAEDRSQSSHNHYFAALSESWRSLPDDLTERFPTVEHLRKFALIKAGFADSRQFVASSKAEAHRLAAFIKPTDDYALVLVSEATVTVWTARSQSMKAMGKKVFEASKEAVLGIIAEMLGVDLADLPTTRAA